MANFGVYVADLAAYNNSILHGVWVDALDDIDTIDEQVRAMLLASPIDGAEEYAIHDTDWDYEWRPGESTSLPYATEMAQALDTENGEALAAFVTHHNRDAHGEPVAAIVEDFTNSYVGVHSSEEDFAKCYLDDTGALDSIPDELLTYFDYEGYATDLFMGDYYSVDSPDGGVFVFQTI